MNARAVLLSIAQPAAALWRRRRYVAFIACCIAIGAVLGLAVRPPLPEYPPPFEAHP